MPRQKLTIRKRKKPLPPHYQEILDLAKQGVFVNHVLAVEIAKRHGNKIKPHAVQAASSRLRRMFPKVFPKPSEFGRTIRLVGGEKSDSVNRPHFTKRPATTEIIGMLKKGQYLHKELLPQNASRCRRIPLCSPPTHYKCS